MNFSRPQRAVMLGIGELEDRDGRDLGWDEAWLRVAAKSRDAEATVTEKTIGSLCKACLLYRRKDARYELTEAGRQRLREGLR